MLTQSLVDSARTVLLALGDELFALAASESSHRAVLGDTKLKHKALRLSVPHAGDALDELRDAHLLSAVLTHGLLDGDRAGLQATFEHRAFAPHLHRSLQRSVALLLGQLRQLIHDLLLQSPLPGSASSSSISNAGSILISLSAQSVGIAHYLESHEPRPEHPRPASTDAAHIGRPSSRNSACGHFAFVYAIFRYSYRSPFAHTFRSSAS